MPINEQYLKSGHAHSKYNVSHNKIILSSGQEVKFKKPIAQVESFVGVLIVRLDDSSGEKLNENVFGVREDGVILWQVAPVGIIHPYSPYTNIHCEGDNIVLGNADGWCYLLEPVSGKILQKWWEK